MIANAFLYVQFFLAILFANVGPSHNSESFLIGRGRMPAVVKDNRSVVQLIYGMGDSLLYTYSIDGHRFNEPQLVEKVTGLNASATRGPQIVSASSGLCVVASTADGSIYSWIRGTDGEWIRAGRVTDADSVALEGFVDVASDGGANLFAVWLDVRNNKRNKLYGARSADGGKTWSENIEIYVSPDSSICECCRASVAMSSENVHVMFRNWVNGNRDLYVISSTDAGKSFGTAKKLGIGSWPLKGCPMDGGDIVVAADASVHTVWRRERTIYACEPGKPEVEIGEGRNCTLASFNGKIAYAWVNNGDVICKLPGGDMRVLGKGSAPVLQAVADNRLLCIWEHEKQLYSSILEPDEQKR